MITHWRISSILLLLFLLLSLNPQSASLDSSSNQYFKIIIVDEETGRGVPLVELKTTSGVKYYSDSNGIVAFYEPGLMDKTVFFSIQSHGYQFPADSLNFRGIAIKISSGGSVLLKIKRINIAERLYRITGEGIYRDSLLVNHPIPINQPILNGEITGQDAGHAIPYRGKIFWFWGDTNRLSYSLGNFASTGATSALPNKGGLDPQLGINLTYFTKQDGFAKEMCPADAIAGPGLKWLFWFITVNDEAGRERLIGQYSRLEVNKHEVVERGLVIFNDEKESFERLVKFDLAAPLYPDGRPFRVKVGNDEYYYFAVLYPQSTFIRVKAQLKDIIAPTKYETFTCLVAGSRYQGANSRLDRLPNGQLNYAWKADTDAMGYQRESELIKAGKMQPKERWIYLQDIKTGEPLNSYSGSVQWNEYHQRWLMLAQQNIGEIWYAEGDTPIGPWIYAQKIVSHDKYTFYLPVHHPFFDQDGGRRIFFEATYTNIFSGNDEMTPRYDYNQVMYQLQLDDPRLALPLPVYQLKGVDQSTHYAMREKVETEKRWNEINDIAFYAISPRGNHASFIPIFSTIEHGKQRLSTTPVVSEGTLSPLFYAIAMQRNPIGGIEGNWQFKIQTSLAENLELAVKLKLSGKQLQASFSQPDLSLLEGSFQEDQLLMVIKGDEATYQLNAKVGKGRLKGEWQLIDGSEKGSWQGEWIDDLKENFNSQAILPLYEYQHNGQYQYTTATHPASAKILCYVWGNPHKKLLLDAACTPIMMGTRSGFNNR